MVLTEALYIPYSPYYHLFFCLYLFKKSFLFPGHVAHILYFYQRLIAGHEINLYVYPGNVVENLHFMLSGYIWTIWLLSFIWLVWLVWFIGSYERHFILF